MAVASADATLVRPRGIRPLPLLTTTNFFNYMDRQVVYSMTPFLAVSFGLSKFRLGLLSLVNLGVFALTSLISGPIADRIGPRKLIFAGRFAVGHRPHRSGPRPFVPILAFFPAPGGGGEGSYGPS